MRLAGKRRRYLAPLIKGDAKLLRRLVRNLLDNAGKHGVLPAEVTIRATTDQAVATFADQGRGITESERENVFRPFYRLDHARNQDSGNTGLGLAITRDIARSHGGDVTLGRSSMGGLRAVIRIPL